MKIICIASQGCMYEGQPINVDEFLNEFIPTNFLEDGTIETFPKKTIDEVTVTYTLNDYNLLRTQEVSQIIVTLADTVTVLDGDEISQGRIARAIAGLPDDITTQTWLGANGDVYNLTKPQLQEALVLAGEAQTSIWVNYATLKASL